MNISEPFVRHPIGTTLLTVAIALAGSVAFYLLPVAPLPQVDYPTISVGASLPGASPQTMAASVATPLERQFGRIAGITEMTSSSNLGTTGITMQFDLSRDIDGAARDVEAAINAARGNLPSDLPSNPSYRKVNPADSPIMIIALTSDIYTKGQMYDSASTVLAQKLSQVDGVGQVIAGGSSLPAVRVELNPLALNKYGIGLENVRTALSGANSNVPKGHFANGTHTWTIQDNDQIFKAVDYKPLIIAYRNSAPVRVGDVADVVDSVADIRNAGFSNGKPSVLLIIFRQPGANIIQTVARINAILPQLHAEIPTGMDLTVVVDQTTTISASIRDVERTLLIAVVLVILVVFIFLRDFRTMFIPAVAVPVSLIGTFGVMYLCGFSLDNLSLMALTISTGFVVDDAIVVVENITRYIEQGMSPLDAALRGSKEIGFTVLSISISLIAVFTPILLMGGLVGRLFREFAVTLSVAILISMVISLTTTPMMCALLLKPQKEHSHGKLFQVSESIFQRVLRFYEITLSRVLLHPAITLLVLIALVILNGYLFYVVPKGFFPQQDTGRLNGNVLADQDTSFQAMNIQLQRMIKILRADPAVANVVGFTGGGGGTSTNTARFFIALKPLGQRGPQVGFWQTMENDVKSLFQAIHSSPMPPAVSTESAGSTGHSHSGSFQATASANDSADIIIARLRPKLAHIPGGTLYLSASQDIRTGGRQANALYQFTLQSDNYQDVSTWAPKLLLQLQKIPILTDVNSDQQNHGMQAMLTYDRDTAARFGITSQLLDNTLYDAFGQRPVSVMYTALNQYQVIMEAAPQYWQNPAGLKDIYVLSPNGSEVPLSALSHYSTTTAPLTINHQGQFPCVTLSFNLAPGKALGDAVNAITKAEQTIGLPASIRGTFVGTAQTYQASLDNEPILIAAALGAVYIVLGILYESFIHPITILTTLPSAAVGAALALLVTGTELSLIAVIGIILLIGIVKKNAIMMIDFALNAERNEGKNSRDAIFEACQLRFRPIMMTTMAAMFGAFPLALDTGTGAELRRPLGIVIIGGLIMSQMLTLYTTPVIYLYWDRLALWWNPSHENNPNEEASGLPLGGQEA
jgi:multidrug efflux pump